VCPLFLILPGYNRIFYTNTSAKLVFRVQWKSLHQTFSSLRVCIFQDCSLFVVRYDLSVEVPLFVPPSLGRHVVDVFTTDGILISGFSIFVGNPPEIISIQSLILSPGSVLKFHVKPFEYFEDLLCFFGVYSSVATVSDQFQCTCEIPVLLIGSGIAYAKFGNSAQATVDLGMLQLLSSDAHVVYVKPSSVSHGHSRISVFGTNFVPGITCNMQNEPSANRRLYSQPKHCYLRGSNTQFNFHIC